MSTTHHVPNSYSTIQEAIDNAAPGDTIEIEAGVYTENLVIDKAITLVGVGAVSIAPAAGIAITISGDLAGGDVILDTLLIEGVSKGIYVEQDANAGKLTITNSDISGASEHGIYAPGDDPDDDGEGPIVSGITAIDIIDTTFSNNGTGGLNGAAHVKLFGFQGDALFQNVTMDGAPDSTPVAQRPDNAIEITGYVNDGNANITPFPTGPDIGTVVFDNVVVTGEYHKNPIAIFHFNDLTGLSIGGDNGGLDLSGAVSDWGPLFNFDGIAGDIDASGYAITFPDTSAIVTELQGDKPLQDESDQTIVGTSSHDAIMGKGGNDTLSGGDGDDILYGHDKPGGAYENDDGDDILDGGAGNDQLFGGAGNDTLIGTEGDNLFDGGDGVDIAVIHDNGGAPFDLGDIDLSGFDATDGIDGDVIVIDGRTQTLTDIEVLKVANTGSSTFIVTEGMSIQDAIDAAEEGDTILIAEGIYNESLVVNKAGISIVGVGNVVIEGPLLGQLGVPDGTPLNDFFEANHPAYSQSTGIQVSADGVSISGLTITSFAAGILLESSSGVSITGNTFVDNARGLWNGPAVNHDITDLTVSDNTFSQGVHGIVISTFDGNSSFDGITMNGNSFSALSEKGMYFEQLSNASLDGNTFDDVGNYGRISPPFGGTDGEFGQAIDINLKYGNYENVVFTDTTITNSGNSDKDGNADPGDFGAAIGIKIRDDGAYAAVPATFTGEITFDGLTIDGTSTGIRVGEPGKNNLGPDVKLTDVTITNATVTDVENATDPANGGKTTVEFSDAQTDLDASSSQADLAVKGNGLANTITTGSGNDTLEGGGGNDVLDGGDGVDTAVYTTVVAAGGIVANLDGGWTVTAGGEGTDTLSNIEIVQHASGRFLLVGNGGFATIADAAAASGAGDVILLNEEPEEIELDQSDNHNDLVLDFSQTSAPITITTGNGDNTITTGAGNDVVKTGSGDDVIKTGDGSDYIDAGGGNDEIIGGSGNGDDVYDGGSGSDTVTYTSATKRVVVDLRPANRKDMKLSDADGPGGGPDTVGELLLSLGLSQGQFVGFARGADIGVDVLISIENIKGGQGNDKITGNKQINVLEGMGGNDTIYGGGGNDILDGGGGKDKLFGEAGNDVLNGGAGKDVLNGGAGKDKLTGGAGKDAFAFDLMGKKHADTITDFKPGKDRIFLENDTFTALGGDNTALKKKQFQVGKKADDKDDRIIYDKKTGNLFYDADGNGKQFGQVKFAKVKKGLELDAGDFFAI